MRPGTHSLIGAGLRRGPTRERRMPLCCVNSTRDASEPQSRSTGRGSRAAQQDTGGSKKAATAQQRRSPKSIGRGPNKALLFVQDKFLESIGACRAPVLAKNEDRRGAPGAQWHCYERADCLGSAIINHKRLCFFFCVPTWAVGVGQCIKLPQDEEGPRPYI